MRRRLLIAACLLVAVAAAPASAETPTVLDSKGGVYRLVKGSCAALGVCPATADGNNQALALEVELPGLAAQRLLVPGTQESAVESYPSLAIDSSSDRVFLVWEAMSTIHSTLHLASFADGGWSREFDAQIAGDSFSFKRNPRIAVTHDSYKRLDDDGEVATEQRLVLHIVWWDEAGIGARPVYTALVVQDGHLLPNWIPVSLLDFLTEGSGDTLPLGLFQSPQIRTVGAGSRAIIAFGDPTGARLATLEVDVVGGDVISFADAARGQVIEIGRRGGNRRNLAGEARGQVIEIGRRLFAAEVGDFLANRFLEVIEKSSPQTPLGLVADDARGQVIEIGRRLREGMQLATAGARGQVIEIGRRFGTPDGGGPTGHVARFRVASVWQAPWVPDRTIRLLTSDDGSEVALAWEVDGAVRYRQLEGDGWSEIRTITLSPQLQRDQAFELIEKRLRLR